MAEIDRKGFVSVPGASDFRKSPLWADDAVEDAEFESIGPGNSDIRVPPLPVLLDPDHLSILKTGTRNGFAPAAAGLPGASYWVLVLLAAFGAFWMSGGHVLAKQILAKDWQAASSIPTGMKLSDVSMHIEAHGGSDVLFVAATVRNEGTRRDRVPELAITIKDRRGTKRDYYLGTKGRIIAPGESLAFSSRLPAPKDRVEAVGVRLSPR